MVFKIGGTTVIDNSANFTSGSSNSGNAGVTGYFDGAGNRIDALNRYFTYTDDYAGNCRGWLPPGNCFGNPNWTAPNGNWWTWGIIGIPTTKCVYASLGSNEYKPVLNPTDRSLFRYFPTSKHPLIKFLVSDK